MLSFECDYAEGAHEAVLQHLLETNLEQLPGYGQDRYCDAAKEKIAYLAYEDQCSPANPRVPMVNDMIEILRASYEGDTSYYAK